MAIEKPEAKVVPDAPAPAVMTVPVDKMETILGRMDAMEKRLTDKDSEIAALNQTVSQTRLQEAKANLDVDKRPRVHFKKVQGKVVIGWSKLEKNELIRSPINHSMIGGEILQTRYRFIDGTESGLLNYSELIDSNEMVFARVIEQLVNSALYEFEDKSVASEPIEINNTFRNA